MRAFFGLVWDGGQSAWAVGYEWVMTMDWVGICIFYHRWVLGFFFRMQDC
jgi:hypothetical protein